MLQYPLFIPLPVSFLVAGALVMTLLALGEADIEFDAAVFLSLIHI